MNSTRENILRQLPEISKIRDADLREKVIAVWVDAVDSSEYSPDEVSSCPASLKLPPEVTLIEHTRAVAQTADFILTTFAAYRTKSPVIDRDTLLAGALLHDVGKLLEYCREDGRWQVSHLGTLMRHPTIGALLAARYRLPAEVVEMVALHSYEGEKSNRSSAAKVLIHADLAHFEPFL